MTSRGSTRASRHADSPRTFSPDRLIWTIDREGILLLGAGRALLLQLAHPLVAAGVAQHSGFTADPLGRLRRTLDTSYALVFGETAAARAAVGRMDAVHRRVHGVLPEPVGRFTAGTPYDAMDPTLRLWVHATLTDTSLLVYQRFVRPLSRAEEGSYYADSREVARLLGLPESAVPPTLDAFHAYVAETLARDVAIAPATRALARQIFHPPRSVALTPVGALLEPITVGLLPPDVRRQYGYAWTPAREWLLAAFATSVRVALPAIPSLVRVVPAARQAERDAARREPSAA
jgi:uncharacterized protein (DUF2236 family)